MYEEGIHVLSEKPLTMTLEELEKVKEAYKSSNVILSMLLTMRFTPSYRKIREVVRAGVLGEKSVLQMLKNSISLA